MRYTKPGRPHDPFQRALQQGGNQVFPPQDTNAAQLGHDMAEMLAIQKNATVVQRWGATVPMPVPNGAPLPTSPQLVINVGPFHEPRALSFETFLQVNDGTVGPELAPGQSLTIGLLYTVVVGIGQASITYQFNELPSVLYAQSLSVSVSRTDNGVFGFVLSCWAQPYAPSGEPRILDTSFYTMGLGTANITIGGPPNWATHVMMSYDALDTVDQRVTLILPAFQSNLNPTGPASGNVRYPMYQKFAAVASGAWMPPQVYPLPASCAGTAVVSRTDTSVQLDVNVNWLRC